MGEPLTNFRYAGAPSRFGPTSLTQRPWATAAPESGPVFDQTTGYLKNRVSKDVGLANFFGNPRQPYIPNYTNDIEEENLDLPQAYEGRNDRMTQLLISEITKEQLWPLYVLFPWKKTKNMSVEWDQWIFNDAMLDRVPEESVPRLLTSHRKQGKTSLVRYGIAFLLEHGFYLTEMGHRHFAMNVQQIKNATVETAAYGALHTAFNWTPYVDDNDKWRNHINRSRNDIDEQFREELETFAILQKSESGAQTICSKMRDTLIKRNNNTAGDVFVIPSGTRKYMEEKFSSLPFAVTGYQIGQQPGNPIDRATHGAHYFESRGFRQGEHSPDDDPTERLQTIGSFNVMNDRPIVDIPPADFRIGELDRILYNGDTDDWDRISYKDNIRYTGLWYDWNTDSPRLSELGDKFFGGVDTIGDYYQSIDGLDYAVDTIEARDADVHQELADLLAAHVDDVSEDIDMANDLGFQKGQKRFQVNALYPDAFESEREYKKEVRRTIAEDNPYHRQTYADAQRGRVGRFHGSGRVGHGKNATPVSDLSKLIELIKTKKGWSTEQYNQSVESRYINRVSAICADYGSNAISLVYAHLSSLGTGLQSDDIYATMSAFLAPYLAKFDVDKAVESNKGSDDRLTPLEKAVQTTRIKVSRATGDVEDKYYTEEAKSIRWFPSGDQNKDDPISIVTDMENGKARLKYNSSAFSLAYDKLVLFDVNEKVVEKLTEAEDAEAKGVPFFVHHDYRYATRVARLQLSIALSAVYACIKMHAKGTIAQNRIIPKIKEVAGKNLAHSDQYMPEVVGGILDSWIDQKENAVLTSQFHLAPVIYICAKLLRAVYEDESDGEINGLIAQLSTFVINWQMIYHMDAVANSGGAYTPYSQRVDKIWKPAASQLNETQLNEFLAFGWDTVKRLNVEIATQRNVQIPVTSDSFYAFFKSYHELFQVYYARQWITESDTGAWQLAVKRADDLFNTYGNGAKANRFVSMYLNILFDYAVDDSSVAAPDVDEIASDENIKFSLKQNQEQLKRLADYLRATTTTKKVAFDHFYKPANKLKLERSLLYENAANRKIPELNTGNDLVAIAEAYYRDNKNKINRIDSYALVLVSRAEKGDDDYDSTCEMFINSITASSNKPDAHNELISSGLQFLGDDTNKQKIMMQYIVMTKAASGHSVDSIINEFENNILEKSRTILASIPLMIDNWQELIKDFYERWPLSPESKKQLNSSMYLTEDGIPLTADLRNNTNENMVSKGQAVKLKTNEIKKILMALPISASGAYMKLCIRRNIFPLIGAIMWRPHQRYVMGSALHMNGFGKAGATCYHSADFQLGDNVAQKMHFGHFTVYSKTVIWDERYITYARNVFCKNYLGGNGCKIWDPLLDTDVDDYQSNDLTRDMFLVAIPITWKTDSYHLDMSGRYHPSLCADANTNLNTLYPSAGIYAEHWGWKNIKNPLDKSYGADISPRFNTLCFQAHEGMYNYGTGDFTRIITEKGHWGDRIYPGCGRVRTNWDKYLKPVNYDGAAVFSLIR